MQIPVGMIATIQFTPLDASGNPAQLDGPLSFELAPGSEAIATLLDESPGENAVDVQANAAGEITILATGDVRLDGGVESVTWTCSVVLYERADHLDCSLVSVRPVVDL